MRGLLPLPKTMIGLNGNHLSYLVEGHITVVISVVAVLILTYVILIPIILGVLGGLLFLLIVFLFATRTGLKLSLFGGHKEGLDKWENSQIKHDEPTTLSGKWACSSEQLPSQGQGLGIIHSLSNDFKVFEKEELVAATENFHHNNKLGQGAFGAVYKGTTSQGSEIAVKKLSLNTEQRKDEFVNEIQLVAKVRHRNLVKLLGCCAEGSERLIVYEYLPNNSLYTFLFDQDQNKRSRLDWEKRYSIILGVSRGLLYLHQDSPLRIIHRDIKAGNILLDTEFNPKIADFGIARLLKEDESHVRTRPAGTRGYWAPEYAMEGQLSVKADVYSFGILLLELISGRKSLDLNLEEEMQVLSDWVRGLSRDGNLASMIDPVIIETCGDKKEQVLRCIHVGLLCIEAEASRPFMSTINTKLHDIKSCRPTPTHDTNSTVICDPSQPSSPSSSSSSSSSHTPLLPQRDPVALTTHTVPRPSTSSTTQSSSHTPLLPQCDPVALTAHTVPSISGLQKSKFWKAKFWGAKFWNSKKAKTAKFWNSKKAKTIYSGYYEGNDSRFRKNQQQSSEGYVLARIPSLSRAFTVFEMETLIVATENFHDNNKLGEGGFGAVYKGTTPEGKEIAVKKLSFDTRQGKKEFLNEVTLVAKVQHRNLVKLLGCCEAGSERLLVYEYLPKNSLDKILFVPDRRRQLDWQKRYNIILDITRGLLYLHEDSHLRIIHRDIKASNILLDKDLNPKIADFGLARLFEEDETSVGTGIAGTRGYMAPEYAMHGQLSAKADVYSFGILLLELISGKRNLDLSLPLEMQMLLQWTWGLYTRGNIEAIIDPVINETCGDQTQVLRCVHVALLCTQGDPLLRPPMSTVNLMLSTGTIMLPDPTEPPFVSSVAPSSNPRSSHHGLSHSSAATASSSSHAPLASNANVSISELEPSTLLWQILGANTIWISSSCRRARFYICFLFRCKRAKLFRFTLVPRIK